MITKNTGRKKSVLFLRNWIRSGVRKVSDLPFISGILNEHSMYLKLNCKKNIYCEIMLVKNALYPYRQCIKDMNNVSLPPIKPLRSQDYYNMYKMQMTCNANITRVTKFLDPYWMMMSIYFHLVAKLYWSVK